MRKAACIAGVAVWVAAAFVTTQALGEDRLIQEIEKRLAQHPGGASINGEANEIMSRISACWNVPPELRNKPGLIVTVEISLNRDGSLAAPPRINNRSQNPLFDRLAASAIAAVHKCAPFAYLPPAKYEIWKKFVVDFNPRAVFTR